MSRRHPRLSECRNMDDFVRGGFALPFSPAVESGHRTYADGRVILPSATNLVRDPQVRQTLGTYWAAEPVDCTITPATAAPVDFGGPAKCAMVAFVYTDSSRDWESEAMAVTAAKKHTAQCLIYAPDVTATGTIAIDAVVMNGASEVRTVALGTVSSENTTAVRYSNTVTVAASGETHIKYRYTFDVASSTVYVSGHKITQYGAVDPYHDGDTSGCAWTGTEHESTSTRDISVLAYPQTVNGVAIVGGAGLAFSAIVTAYFAGNDGLQHEVAACAFAAGYYYLSKTAANVWRTAVQSTGTAVGASTAGVSWEAGTQHVVMGRAVFGAGGTLNATVDGVSASAAQTNPAPTAGTVFRIGGSRDATLTNDYLYPLNGGIRNVVTSPVAESDTYYASLSAAQTAGYDAVGLFRNYCLGTVGRCVIPLTSDSLGYMALR